MRKIVCLVFLFACSGPVSYAQAINQPVSDRYYCPPCGNPDCDTIAYDHPGNCPICRMPLVKRTNHRAVNMPATAGEFSGHWEGIARTTDQQLEFSLDISTDSLANVLFSANDLNAMKVTGTKVECKSNSLHFELAGDDAIMQFDGTLANGKITGRFITNDQSAAAVNRNGSFDVKKVKIIPVNYTVKDVSFHNGSVLLSGSLYLPIGPGKFPAVVCNHSSGDKARYDGAFMADFLARRGIAVLIYDKRGDGGSTGDWRTSDFEDLSDDCIAGVHLLQTVSPINNGRIGIFGHSQGATISPIIVTRCPDIAFNIAAAGFAVSPPEQDIFRVTNILHHEAHLTGSAFDSAISFYKLWLEVARTGKGWDNMEKENVKVKTATWYAWVEPPPATSWLWKWYLKAGNYNYPPFWEKVNIPTLLIYGENDEVTPVNPSVAKITAALKKAGNKHYKVEIMPNAIHYFAQVKKKGDLWTKTTPGYFENMYEWILSSDSKLYIDL